MSSTTMTRRGFAPIDLAYIAIFAALLAAMALAPPIPLSFGVPITLQTLGVALAGLCLGAWRGAVAVALYLAVAAAGLPILAGGRGGLSVFLSTPSGGYLISFVFATALIGLVAQIAVARRLSRFMTGLWFLVGTLAARYLVIFPLGVAGIARVTGKPFAEVWMADIAFWPGDLIKNILAVLIALAVHKAFPRLLGR